MKQTDLFYAKILLLGEYGVILGSKALSIPYTHFSGELSFITEDKYTDYNKALESNSNLKEYAHFLKQNKEIIAEANLDLERFISELDAGLYFESSIPQGYGVGSSGALVASIFSRYSMNNGSETAVLFNDRGKSERSILNPFSPSITNDGHTESKPVPIKLKEILSRLESYFHGQSSGIDPLNAYIKAPLLVSGPELIEVVKLPGKNLGKQSAIFLIDSGMPGKTGKLVEQFMAKCLDSGYNELMRTEYIPLINSAIGSLIDINDNSFFDSIHKISEFQREHMTSLIPDSMLALWDEGLRTNLFSLKLCGSGGGGYILGFTKDELKTNNLLKSKQIELIPVFRGEHS